MVIPLVEGKATVLSGSNWHTQPPNGYGCPLVGREKGAQNRVLTDAERSVINDFHDAGGVPAFPRAHRRVPTTFTHRDAAVVRPAEIVCRRFLADDSVVWTETSLGHRTHIRPTERAGFEVVIERLPRSLDTFRRLLCFTMDILGAWLFCWFNGKYFADLAAALGRVIVSVRVVAGGNVLETGLFGETCGIAQHHLSNLARAFKGFAPTKLIFRATRTWAGHQGVEHLHLKGWFGWTDGSAGCFQGGLHEYSGVVASGLYRAPIPDTRWSEL